MEVGHHPLLRGLIDELDSLSKEKLEIDEKKRSIDEKIDAHMSAILSLQRVYGGQIPQAVLQRLNSSDMGITEHIRELFRAMPKHELTAPDVKNLLEQRKVPLKYTQPLAVIHQVLRRLVMQEELDTREVKGQALFRLKGPIPAPRSTLTEPIQTAYKR